MPLCFAIYILFQNPMAKCRYIIRIIDLMSILSHNSEYSMVMDFPHLIFCRIFEHNAHRRLTHTIRIKDWMNTVENEAEII